MIQFQVLGRTDLLRDDGVRVSSVLTQPKRVAFLAYLALARPRGLHRRDALLARFWPELDESQGRAALRQSLFFLRRSLGSDVFSVRGAGEVGIDRTLLRTDVEEVEAALGAGRAGVGTGAASDGRGSDETLEALEALVERPLLDGLHVGGLSEFEHWLDDERSRLRGVAREAAARLGSDARAAGDLGRALDIAALGLRLDPFDTAAARRFLELKLRTGDRAGAKEAWRGLEERHRRELGEAPDLDFESMLETVAPEAAEEWAEASAPRRASPESGRDTAPRRWVPGVTGRGRYASFLRMVVLLAVVAAIGPVGLEPRAALPGTIDPMTVAVFPPTVRGPADLAYLSASLAPLIAEGLEEGGGVRVISSHAVLEVVADEPGAIHLERAGEIAAALGVGRLVLTDIAVAGDSLFATASLYRTGGGEEARTGVVVSTRSDLSRTARLIAGGLLARLANLEGRHLDGLAAETTDSLRAYRRFALAEADYRAGRFPEALTGFESAFRIDPTFAVAWYRAFLIAPVVLGTPAEPGSASALDLDRLPRPYGLLMSAALAAWDGKARNAEELAARAAALEDEAEIWAFLGTLRLTIARQAGGSLESARKALARAHDLDPSHPMALEDLRAYARLVEDDTLAASPQLAAAPSYPATRDPALLPARLRRRLAELETVDAVANGRWAEAVGAARALDARTPRTAEGLADYVGAPIVGARLLLTPFARPARAEIDDCVRRLRSWTPETPRARAERAYLLARLHLAAGDAGEAERLAAGLDRLAGEPADGRSWAGTYATAVRIDEALHRGATAEAARLAESLDLSRDVVLGPLLLHEARWSVPWLVAEALFAAGRLDRAAGWYEGLGAGGSAHFLQAKRLRTGQIRQRLGGADDAVAWYRRIVEGPGVPDPELQPPLDSARAALARLEGVRGILWLDDAPDNNVRERKRLEDRGILVTVALSTKDALERYRPDAFQLVISDMGRYEDAVYRPRAGLELLSRLRERGAGVRIVFFTSEGAVAAFRDEALAIGGDGITASTEELFRLIGSPRVLQTSAGR